MSYYGIINSFCKLRCLPRALDGKLSQGYLGLMHALLHMVNGIIDD